MNLIQIQENLKDLPTQAIMSYANGQNPQVPPYMALSELNRRKSMEQRAAQQPTASVKDQLEAAVTHQPPPGQPMPPGAPQMPQGPQGIAQLPSQAPQAPQGQPQGQPPSAPPGMAGGGLAGLHVDDEMFNYAPGGIVAFANETNDQVVPEEEMGDETYSGPAGRLAVPRSPKESGIKSSLASLPPVVVNAMTKAISGGLNDLNPADPEDIRREIMEKNPELAKLANTIPGSDLVQLSTKLKEQNEASKNKFQESQGRMGLAGLAKALNAAGEATRGHKGMGLGEALGGYATAHSNFIDEDVKRQQAQTALERQQSIEVSKLDADIAALQQAYAKAQLDGRVADAANLKKSLLDLEIKRREFGVGAAKDFGTLVNSVNQTESQRAHYQDQATKGMAQLEIMRAQNKEVNRRADEALGVNKDLRQQQIEEKNRRYLDQAIKEHPVYKEIAKKLSNRDVPIEIGSPEYDKIMDDLDRIEKKIIAQHPNVNVPDTSGQPKYAKNAQGDVIVSYDDGTTWKPATRTITNR
jgi:hypothetical protein